MILRLTYSCYHHHPPRFPALKTWSCPWFVLCPTLDSFGYQLPLTLTCCEFTHFSASPMSLLSKLLPVVWPGPFNSLPACCPILRTLPSNSSSDWCRISCLSSADNFQWLCIIKSSIYNVGQLSLWISDTFSGSVWSSPFSNYVSLWSQIFLFYNHITTNCRQKLIQEPASCLS